jgi:hypothetical protein
MKGLLTSAVGSIGELHVIDGMALLPGRALSRGAYPQAKQKILLAEQPRRLVMK